MSETEDAVNKPASQPVRKYFRLLFIAVVAAAAIYYTALNIGVLSNVLKVLLGFGSVVIVHEFGHFIVAKLSGIKVEAFSIFMPPTLFGVRRTKDGLKFRFVPGLFVKEKAETDGDKSSSADEKIDEADGTEYRIGLIPFGGFVKMLGQEDTGPVKECSDPRSFANKPVGVRMGVITAGVVFNVISAVAIFMTVFLVGINLPPAVVGGVVPGSPAERAGLMPGDEVIEIAGKTRDLDFSNLSLAAALSDTNEAVPMKVVRKERRDDGTIEESIKDFAVVAKQMRGEPMKAFGIYQPAILTIAKVSEPNKLQEKTGFLPGDKVVAVNGKKVQSFWELATIVENSLAPEVVFSAERTDKTGELKQVESKIGLEMVSLGTGHIYSMVPRLRMEHVTVTKSIWEKITAKGRQLLEWTGIIKKVQAKPFLQSGDIILSIGKVVYPTYQEFREVVKKHGDKELPIEVVRTDANGIEKSLTINVIPKRSRDVNEAAIGITYLPMFDTQNPVLAKTIDTEGGPAKLEMPRGATITAVDGVGVSSLYDVIREIRRHPGESINIDWRLNKETAGNAVLVVDNNEKSITFKSAITESVPFEDMRRVYKATGPVNAIAMGYRKTIMFITQTYITLKRLVAGIISPKHLMGPVGIIALSYNIVAHQPLIYYLYLLGLISAMIAVFNFLPLPPLDGGLIVLMLIEKFKGSSLSERTQGVIAYAGWGLIGTLFLYVTFNDIVRVIFG